MSSKKKDYSKVLSLTECKLCDSELVDPRRIECEHVLCLQCLCKHVAVTSVDSLSCPICKRPMKPPSGKVENYPVAVKIVALLRSLNDVARFDKTGDENSEEAEQNYDYINSEEIPPVQQAEDVCDSHGETLIAVCLDCEDELICTRCSIHATHKKRDISEHNQELSRILYNLTMDLKERESDDASREETLQDMIDLQTTEKDAIKEELEEITQDLYTAIHWKKEEMIRPMEEKADVYVKQLSERKEHITSRISEYININSRIGSLSPDDAIRYFQKAKKLVKQAKLVLKIERKQLPGYQKLEFLKNESTEDAMRDLELGNIYIHDEASLEDMDEEYEEDTYDDITFEWGTYENIEPVDIISRPPPPPQSQKPPLEPYQSAQAYPRPQPRVHRPPPIVLPPTLLNPGPQSQDHPPSLPPRTKRITKNVELSKQEDDEESHPYCHYTDADDVKSLNSHSGAHMYENIGKPKTLPAFRPEISPFSGTFRKSSTIRINKDNFRQSICYRVFLPFRFSGFTVVQGRDIYYTFVTDACDVQMYNRNGDLFKTIAEGLVKPFDAASQQRGREQKHLYVTDQGRRPGEGSVKVYTSEGQFQKVLVGKLKKPLGISVSQAGQVYVCDEIEHCICVFCPKTGRKKRVISTIDKEPLFTLPMYVMVSVTGKLLVSDVGTRQLKLYDETRKYTDKFKPDADDENMYTSFAPAKCAEDTSSNYYVIDQETNSLYLLHGRGMSEKLDLPQKPKDHDGIPTAVAFDFTTGNIVVF